MRGEHLLDHSFCAPANLGFPTPISMVRDGFGRAVRKFQGLLECLFMTQLYRSLLVCCRESLTEGLIVHDLVCGPRGRFPERVHRYECGNRLGLCS